MDTIHSDVPGNEHELIVLLYLKGDNTLDVSLEVFHTCLEGRQCLQ